MTSPVSPIDSVLLSLEAEAPQNQWPASQFPPYTDQRLRDFLERFSTLAGDNLADGLSRLSEPGLYALAMAIARGSDLGLDPRAAAQARAVIPSLRTELRRRGGQGLGADPIGPVRRGRLLQIIGAFTALTAPGTASRGWAELVGACPFCAAPSSFRVLLPQVLWECRSCARSGALLQFAECLLEVMPSEAERPTARPRPTPGNDPAAA